MDEKKTSTPEIPEVRPEISVEAEVALLEGLADSLQVKTGDFNDAAYRAEAATGTAGAAKVEQLLGETSEPGSRDVGGRMSHVEVVEELSRKIDATAREAASSSGCEPVRSAAKRYAEKARGALASVKNSFQRVAGRGTAEKSGELAPTLKTSEVVYVDFEESGVVSPAKESTTESVADKDRKKEEPLDVDTETPSRRSTAGPTVPPPPTNPPRTAENINPEDEGDKAGSRAEKKREKEKKKPVLPIKEPKSVAPDLEKIKRELGFVDVSSVEIMKNFSEAEAVFLEHLLSNYNHARQELSLAEADDKAPKKEKKKKKKMPAGPETVDEDTVGISSETNLAELQAKLETVKEEINNFYAGKIKEILAAKNMEDLMTEEQVREAAETIQQALESSIEAEVNLALSGQDSWKGLAKGFGKNALKMGAIAGGTAATLLGTAALLPVIAPSLVIGGVAAAGGALGGASVSRLYKYLLEKRQTAKAGDKIKEVAKERDRVLQELFKNKDKVRGKISATLSNVLRDQTNEQARELLGQYQSEQSKGADVLKQTELLGEVAQEFYYRAYNMISADPEYAKASPDQVRSAAVMVAEILAQHERNEIAAKDSLDRIKKEKPGYFKLIARYNLAQGGFKGAESEQDDNIITRHKHTALSIGFGATMAFAVQQVGLVRVATGALSALVWVTWPLRVLSGSRRLRP
ncbi:MAG: hypothetical protein C3F02_01125 [Parcubacteria group bacterium]|nr:MAG: hypothetical protein C3F02_01125 [Parcubacteria group bacterium]